MGDYTGALRGPYNRRMKPLAVLLAATLTACTSEQVSRGIYEGSRGYNKSIESTPLEKSRSELPPYDQYKKERDGAR